MLYFILELKRRNPVLFWYGVLNFAAAIICLVLSQTTDTMVNGVNALIKPLKFYLSIGIFVWTIGWLLYYLESPRKVFAFNVMTVLVFTFESYVITWQAVHGRLSHFNIDDKLYSALFDLMGLAITVLTVWTGYMGYLFFRKKHWALPRAYLWGIRLGILFFTLFAFEGFLMAAALKHTVGAPDGGKGLALVNWSREHGDLRIAHFFGMHTLQIFPLFGYYLARSNKVLIGFVVIYVCLVGAVLTQALRGSPLF